MIAADIRRGYKDGLVVKVEGRVGEGCGFNSPTDKLKI